MYGILTDTGGSYGLPVTTAFNNPREVVVDGVTHPRQIWAKYILN